MMYLTIMSGFAITFTVAIMILLFRKRNLREILKYCLMGLFVAFIDIIIEFLGTTTGHWTYHESIYFIFNFIPIELVFLFFSAGIIARFIFLNMNKIKIPIKANAIFYILILLTFLIYTREIYQESKASILPLAILIGLWGISNISNRNKEGALILALLAAGADWISETIIIGSGSYSYKNGFDLSIPFVYGLFTLGLLAVMEKLHKLDELLDHPFVRNLLKLFGVYREKYVQKFREVKNRVTKELKEKTNGFLKV